MNTINRCLLESKVTVNQTLSGADLVAATVNHSAFNTTADLSPTTTPAVTAYAAQTIELAGGAATLDLTLFGDPPLADQNFTGLRLRTVKFKSKAANQSPINIQDGAANGYGLMGVTWSVTLQPGQEILFYADADAPLVNATAKIIDITNTGTGSDSDLLEVAISAG